MLPLSPPLLSLLVGTLCDLVFRGLWGMCCYGAEREREREREGGGLHLVMLGCIEVQTGEIVGHDLASSPCEAIDMHMMQLMPSDVMRGDATRCTACDAMR